MAIITAKNAGGYRTDVAFSNDLVKFFTDAPANHGGKGEYPSPVGIFAASLAACALTTACMAADKMEVNNEAFTAEVENIVVDGKVDAVKEITVRMHFGAGVDPSQRKRLEAFTQRACTVGNSITVKKNFIFDYE